MRKYRVGLALLISLLALGLVGPGCGQLAREIDRVQPDYLEKSLLLEGEWYYRPTVIDAPFTTFYTFVGDQGKLERGIFEVQEKTLYFFRTYEFIEGSEKYAQRPDKDTPLLDKDGNPQYTYMKDVWGDYKCRALLSGEQVDPNAAKYCKAGETLVKIFKFVYRGAPVAAWPISGHFDIRYDYNALTGEKTNVKLENATDKFWYERKHMRVDWSSNQVNNYEYTMGALKDYVVLSTYEGESADKNSGEFPVFSKERLDFVTKHHLEAPSAYIAGYGTVPLCLFYPDYLGGFFECEPENFKVRHSFLKVDNTDNYQPLRYDDKMMEKFGYFRTERLTYDRLFGTTYTGIIQYINRFNIWKKWVTNEFGEPIYSQMEVKPIVYHLSEKFPRKYVQASMALVASWNLAFKDTVKALSGKDADVYILCENNKAELTQYLNTDGSLKADAKDEAGNPIVLARTDAACGDFAEAKRNGDLRFNYLFMVNAPQQNGPLGFGPSSADPLSGKIINANAYVYGAALERYGVSAMDIVDVLLGVKSENDIRNSRDIFKEMFNKGYSIDKAQKIAAGLVSEKVALKMRTQGLEKSTLNYAQARLNIIRQNPSLERSLMIPEVRQLFNLPRVSNDQVLTKEELDKVSIANWGHVQGWKKSREFYMRMSKRTLFLAEFADNAIFGLAQQFAKRYDYEVCNTLKSNPLYLGVYVDGQGVLQQGDTVGQIDLGIGELTAPKELPHICQDNGTTDPAATCTVSGLRTKVTQAADTVQAQLTTSKNAIDQIVLQFEKSAFSGTATFGGQTLDYNTSLNDALADVEKKKDALADAEAKLKEVQFSAGDTTTAQGAVDAAKVAVGLSEATVTQLKSQLSGAVDQNNKSYSQYKQDQATLNGALSTVLNQKVALGVKLDNVIHTARLKFRDELRLAIYKAVMEHEVGHTLGLRHNFEGSTDAMNFHPDFWHVRTNCGTAPMQPLQKEETWMLKHSQRAYQYSSIMDYHAKFNSDFKGIGLYDRAAIKFGYGQLVEVFNSVNDVSGLIAKHTQEPDALDPGNTAIYDETHDKLEKVFKRVDYTKIPELMTGDWRGYNKLYERTNVKWKELQSNQIEVPYRFCSDDYVGTTPTCQLWDEGVNSFEIVRNLASDYESYFLFWGNKRDKVLFTPSGYFSRVMSNFDNMRLHFQVWAANYARYNKNDWWKSKYGTDWHMDPDAGLSGTLAAYTAFNAIIGAMTRPEPNTYYKNANTGVFEVRRDGQNYQPTVTVSFAETDGAREFFSQYNYEGYIYKVRQAGAMYDRLAAFSMLTDPSTYFYGVDDTADSRRFLINFKTMFPDTMMNVFGGMLADNYKKFGWRVEQINGKNVMRPAILKGDVDDVAQTNSLPGINPTPNYLFPTTKYWLPSMAAYYGMSLMSRDYDNSFTDAVRVWIKGNDAPVTTNETIEYTDCLNGRTYVGAKYLQNGVINPTFELLEQAKNLMTNVYKDSCANYQTDYNLSELQYVTGKLEILRSYLKLYDY